MGKIAKIFIFFGLLIVVLAVFIRLPLGRPYTIIGIKSLSLLTIANTLFILAILFKLFEKRR